MIPPETGTVSLIAAVAENSAIGHNNDLIWSLPLDLQYFKRMTQGHVVIMGRKNYESIPEKYRPLPGRPNVVLTTQSGYEAPGAHVVHSLEEALQVARELGDASPFIIGGAQVYALALETGIIQRMYLTWVHETFEADAFFPEVKWADWQEVASERQAADSRHAHAYTFAVYDRKTPE